MLISEILDKAADLVEPEGAWIQRCFSNGHGSYCAAGAVIATMSREAGPYRSETVLAKLADVLPPSLDGDPVTVWNDAPERTQAEVVAKLREAAAKARDQGQ